MKTMSYITVNETTVFSRDNKATVQTQFLGGSVFLSEQSIRDIYFFLHITNPFDHFFFIFALIFIEAVEFIPHSYWNKYVIERGSSKITFFPAPVKHGSDPVCQKTVSTTVYTEISIWYAEKKSQA